MSTLSVLSSRRPVRIGRVVRRPFFFGVLVAMVVAISGLIVGVASKRLRAA